MQLSIHLFHPFICPKVLVCGRRDHQKFLKIVFLLPLIYGAEYRDGLRGKVLIFVMQKEYLGWTRREAQS